MGKRSGTVTGDTRTCILQAARDEFLEFGYEGASLRRICAAAGVTTGAIYFFFSGKEELFRTIVAEAAAPNIAFMKAHYEAERAFQTKSPEENKEADLEAADFLLDSYFQRKRTWDLILRNRQHPVVQTFLDEFVSFSVEHYAQLLALGGLSHPVDRFALHQFVHMQVDTMFTILAQDFTREEMLEHANTAVKMLRGAFYALLDD